MEHELAKQRRELEDRSIFRSPPRTFRSVTRQFIELSRKGLLKCPSCKSPLDMERSIEWYGPEDFECQHCRRMIRLNRLKYLEDYIDHRL